VPRRPRVETLPLFPLANVVLFPGVRAPLHVFEPRYRQLTADVIEGERAIGMIAVRPEHADRMAGDPPLFSVGCSGLVEQSGQRPDGRYDLVLLGTHRFRILEERPREGPRLYRVALAEVLEERFDEGSEGARLQAMRADVVDLLGPLLRHLVPRAARQLDPRRFSGIDDDTFVNALCQLLDLHPAEKQGLLEADGPRERCERLLALLRFAVAQVAGGVEPSERLH
jgi:uncharacterized protein